MKKISLLLAIVAMTVCFAVVTVYAGTNISTATNIYVNNEISNTTSRYNNTEYYKFTINYTGIVSFPATWWSEGYSLFFDLYDAPSTDMSNFVASWYYTGSESAEELVLDAGTYYLEVTLYDSDARYSFTVEYEGVDESVPETKANDNDTIANADVIHMNKLYTGVMTERDDYDYYKFYVSEPSYIALAYSDYNTCTMRLSDANDGYVYRDSREVDEEDGVVTEYYEIEEPGTYYLKAYTYNDPFYFFAIYNGDEEIVYAPARSVNNNVTVSIPTFPVTINGIVKDNTYAQYPYIVYNNITYCPMTYHGARFLGLNTAWNKSSGLTISKLEGGSVGNGDMAVVGARNSGNYTATKTEDFVRVNGKEIDNFAEQYPILVFRDVTYFPLTWRFAVTEFGWDYSFTNQGGLVINSK